MQALRSLWGSAGGDNVNLQAISEQLRTLPQQILQKTGGVATSSDQPCQRRGRVSGDHRYHFSLHFEPRSEGGGLCQTGVLVATATARSDGGQPVPITCHWKRRIGAHLIEIPGINGSMYHTSADDIGMDIVCHAEPAGDPGLGQAYAVMGPFELDPITRMSLENLISSGGSRFPVRHYRNQDDPHPRDLQIHVTQDYVKVVHPGAESRSHDHEFTAAYSADYPKVVIHPLDTCKFRLELSEDREKIYHFVALSRPSRDLIALLIRCFHSRKYVANSFILSRLFQNPATPGAPLTSVTGEDFDVHALGERLGKELNRTVGQLELVEKVVRNANNEKRELQSQLHETIGSYTTAIEKLHDQLSVAKGGASASLQLQLHDTRAQSQRLQLELQQLRQQCEDEQQKASAAAEANGTSADVEEVSQLRGEIARLRTGISSIAGDAAVHSQRDQTRTEELKRLRQDVDMLNSEKEGLEQSATQADREKQDLIENFLYVKGCLDKMQMASVETPAVSPEIEREIVKLKEVYGQIVDDRNRLAVRVEALDRDREKQKQHREQALERVMTANAKSMEERDRLEKEKTRVSELYHSTMTAMGAVPEATSSGGYPGGGAGDPAELEALQAQLARQTELLSKREQESESLRARLRKLAMV